MESDFTLPEAEEPCDSARIQLYKAAGPRPGRPDRSDFTLPEAEEPCDSARTQLCKAAEASPDLLKVRLYINIGIRQLIQDQSYLE